MKEIHRPEKMMNNLLGEMNLNYWDGVGAYYDSVEDPVNTQESLDGHHRSLTNDMRNDAALGNEDAARSMQKMKDDGTWNDPAEKGTQMPPHPGLDPNAPPAPGFFDRLFDWWSWTPQDPLVIDLDGDGIELKSLQDSNVRFDLDGDGFAERTGWVGPDDGLLAVDSNGNVSPTDTPGPKPALLV